MPLPTERPTSGSFFGPRTSRAITRMTMSSGPPMFGMSRTMVEHGATPSRRLPPEGRLEVLDLFEGTRVDARREVLPAVVADDEDHVALVELVGDPHRDRGDGA